MRGQGGVIQIPSLTEGRRYGRDGSQIHGSQLPVSGGLRAVGYSGVGWRSPDAQAVSATGRE